MANDERVSPWDWPAVWWRDEKFWREVATRTIAGVLAILLIGVPGVIYGTATGSIPASTAGTIFTGLAFFTLIILIYATVRLVSGYFARLIAIRELKRSLQTEEERKSELRFRTRVASRLASAFSATGTVAITVGWLDSSTLETISRFFTELINR